MSNVRVLGLRNEWEMRKYRQNSYSFKFCSSSDWFIIYSFLMIMYSVKEIIASSQLDYFSVSIFFLKI